MKKNKKGSHVGVVLSFTIFVVFLIFLFSALQPALKTERDKTSTLTYIKDKVIEMSSDNLTIKNIKYTVSSALQVDCIEISDDSGEKALVKRDGSIVPYSKTGEVVTIYNLIIGDNFFKVYYSNSIDEQVKSGSCSNPGVVEEAAFVDKRNIIFISKFTELSEKDYDLLKQTFGIGEESDFEFTLLDAEKNPITSEKEVDIKTNVYVDNFPILYSDNKGELKSGFINIKVW